MDKKSPDAFRTISEVADWLGVPTHVLRFWESRFTQVKPVKRAGGRRYYRPADMELLGGIRKLLHEDGMTIRGVQKLLREKGVKHVAAMSPPLDSNEMRNSDGSNVVPLTPPSKAVEEPETNDALTSAGPADEETPPVPQEATEAPQDAAIDETPPTLTDAAEDAASMDAAPEDPVDDGPAEPDLFAPEFLQVAEMVEESEHEPEPTAPEHHIEPTELDADIAASHPEEDVSSPVDDDTVFDAAVSQDTPEPEVAQPAEEEPVAEPDPVPEAPSPIDISHVAADVSDDAFPPAPDALAVTRLRVLRAAGTPLPEDALRNLTARLSDLAARMAPAPSDNGQAE
ncbi:MerR family transcriptional regulator [Aliiroseovarius marinus]|uniref:MerR family transcriptional regulator n=1 Tax=Aliiroseovarius marinus TaxID=2500159 RepID=UPI001F0EFF46|nr:MerR family transcriptional regulator [Aliiroseovarius marinus]